MSLVKPEDWRTQGIDGLEENAWEALREVSRSVCVTAGAGAGKTEFLAQKAAYLLQTGLCAEPQRILAISFKRDAASNLERRLEARCPEQARRFTSITFDGFTKGFIDRFRLAIPAPFTPPRGYRIGFPNFRDIGEFLTNRGFHGLNAGQLLDQVARTPLPLDNGCGEAVRAYWKSQFNDYDEAILTFPMINRLVEWVIRENHYIRRALRGTFSHVFLDEFQDTTYPQFDLLDTAFQGSGAVFTAVGDRKQCIMGWAGAMDDSFSEFEARLEARTVELLSNWRSHAGLVEIQHAIAQKIDPTTKSPNAQSELTVDGEVSAVWMFPNPVVEASGLAAWFAREIERGLSPQDCVILVRNRADIAEEQLAKHFLKREVKIRNVARMVGEIAVQDVLEEALTQIVVPLLRLGASNNDPGSWSAAFDALLRLHGVSEDDEQAQERLQSRLQTFVRSLRAQMQAAPPTEEAVAAMYEMVLTFLSREVLRNASPSYRREQDLDRVSDGVKELLRESVVDSTEWSQVLDQFEGVGQLPLMTIHKSKGLEFHTVVFHGLDDQTWWSLTANRPEELRAFFVAFTRAKQRAFFTLCHSRGKSVSWIEELLMAAGVGKTQGPNAEDHSSAS